MLSILFDRSPQNYRLLGDKGEGAGDFVDISLYPDRCPDGDDLPGDRGLASSICRIFGAGSGVRACQPLALVAAASPP